MICKFGFRECDGCMRCHEEGVAMGLEQCCQCREWHEIEDLFSGICKACLLDDEEFKANAYLYIATSGLEEDFYCGYVCDMPIGASLERVRIEKHKFWQFYESHAPFQDILRMYIDDDLHHYAEWMRNESVSLADMAAYLRYFKDLKGAA